MGGIDKALGLAIHQLVSDDSYVHSLGFYRLWFGIGQAHH